jgi:predicted PurR-regulated permease PerM
MAVLQDGLKADRLLDSNKLALPLSSSVKNNDQLRSYALPIIAFGVIMAVLYFGRVFFITALAAIIIAFILDPFVGILVRIKFPRPVASGVICVLAALILYFAGLGAYSQIASLIDTMPSLSQRLGELEDAAQQHIANLEDRVYKIVVPRRQVQQEKKPEPPPPKLPRVRKRGDTPPVTIQTQPAPGVIQEVRIHNDENPLTTYISQRIGTFYQALLMASFVPFLVYFMLSWRDHIHRTFLHFFQGGDRMIAARSLRGVGDMVRGYVVGNFVLGCILSILSSTAFWMMHLEYPLLAGPISGFLSLLPYVGLPLAMAPPLVLMLASGGSVSKALAIMSIVAALHLMALNLFYPKVVGARVHLNPLVVTFSLMFWGFLWDAAGLLLAIPLTAAIKAVCDNVVTLRPYGRFLGD